MRHRLLVVLSAAALVGCSSSGPKVVTAATPEQHAALIERVRSLEGTWEMDNGSGGKEVAAVFADSSNGTAVREVMFPGSGHEMTNVYHMDGPTLLMTHYCSQGNQPHLRARAGSPSEIVFTMDSVSNYTDKEDMYMGKLVLKIKDNDHIVEEWTSYKPELNPATVAFEMTRKK